jgi:DNA-binding NarL/FixJ family response regulator
MASTARQTAVIVDPHPLWLGAITPVVMACDLTVVATATSAEEGLRLVEEHQPDVLVTELDLDGGDEGGTRAIREVRERSTHTKTVVVSSRRDMSVIDAALDAGAAAYVTKTAHPEDIASAIRQAFDQSLFLANRGSGPGEPRRAASPPRDNPAPEVDLTQRELTILQLAAEGHSNSELARRLWVTEQTVKFHLSNVYRKLGVSNRTEASRWAQLHGLLGTSGSVESAA